MLKSLIGKAYMKMSGWTVEGSGDIQKAVVIAAPHTSNWDLPPTVSAGWILGVKVNWLGKDSLFKFPFGWFMKGIGGIPIDRSKKNDFVQQAAEMIRSRERILLVVPPEGTRGGGSGGWRSGFYYIALEAGVPIILGSVQHDRKVASLGEVLWPTGDVKADMDRIRAYYKPEMARYPDKFMEPRLRSEIERTDADRAEADAESAAANRDDAVAGK